VKNRFQNLFSKLHRYNADSDDEKSAVGHAPSEDNVELETWILKVGLYKFNPAVELSA
jgi:hypothetical protein